jgi:hypothetical protein
VKHTPPNGTTSPPQQEMDDQNKRLNYSQAKVYIKKEGDEKWLAA